MKLTVTQNINKLNLKVTQNNTIVKLQPIVNTNSSDFTETDPIFQASEASLFVTGDKANLDNQSGINTGDETTLSIQTKRPLKTINGESLEGSGNVQIDYNDLDNIPTPISNHSELNLDDGTNPHGTTKSDVGLSNVDNTSDIDKPISIATQQALDLKANASDLGDVAVSNDYNDLDNLPTIPNNLEELHNVTETNYTTPIDADSVLTFDVTNSLWKRLSWVNIKTNLKTYFDTLYVSLSIFNDFVEDVFSSLDNKLDKSTTPSSVYGTDASGGQTMIPVSNFGTVKGTGTTNRISKFTASGTIGDSQIFDNGTNVGIGTNTPSTSLDVLGALTLRKTSENAQTILTINRFNSVPMFKLDISGVNENQLFLRNDNNQNIITFARSGGVTVQGFLYSNTELGIGRSIGDYLSKFLSTDAYGSFYELQTNIEGVGWGSLLQWNRSRTYFNILSNNVGIGTTSPQARLDVRAQGALATDIAFRVRNSTDTRNFLVVNGVGDVYNNGAGGGETNTHFGENTARARTGDFNSTFGNQAGRDLTTGASNALFGYNAGRSITTASGNVLIGTRAGELNTVHNTVAIGVNALLLNKTGTSNVAVGAEALYFTTASGNTAVGDVAGFLNTTGQRNIFLGYASGRSNTTGQYNTYIGSDSGTYQTTGNNNIFLGISSGRYEADGVTNLTTATNSLFIGNDTRGNLSGQTNQIVIGFNATGDGSNSVVLGNSSITRTRLQGQVIIGSFASAPTGIEGAIYYNSTDKKHYGFNGTTWNALY